MDYRSKVASLLLQIKAIKLSAERPFTWASGLLSPIYCDNRLILSSTYVRNVVRDALVHASADMPPFQAVAGVATAGIAHGFLLAEAVGLPFAYVRNAPKDHGRKNLIEGQLPPGTHVLVVEDLISTAGSSLMAVDALRAAELEVVGLLAIFSYQFDVAQQALDAARVPCKTLTDYTTLMQIARAESYVSEVELQKLQQWRIDPKAWSAIASATPTPS